MRSTVGELETRTSNEIANRTRNQYFTRIGQCGNSRGKMYGYALSLLAANFTLTSMQSSPNTDA
jgi:hypothetical protein